MEIVEVVSEVFNEVLIESICDGRIDFYTESGRKFSLKGQRCEESFSSTGVPYGCFVTETPKTECRAPIQIHYKGDRGRVVEQLHRVSSQLYLFACESNYAVFYDSLYNETIMHRDGDHPWEPQHNLIYGRIDGKLYCYEKIPE